MFIGQLSDVCFQQSREDGGGDGGELSTLDYLHHWLSSVHAHASANTRPSVDNETLSPPIFIVGTHRDSVHPDASERQKIVRACRDRK